MAPPPPQDPSPLRGTLGSSLRSPAEGEGQDLLRLSMDNLDHTEVLGQRISFQDPKNPAASHYPPASGRGFLI